MYEYNIFNEYIKFVPFKSTVNNKLIYINIKKLVAIEFVDKGDRIQLQINCGIEGKYAIEYRSYEEALDAIKNAFKNGKENNE